MTPEKSVAKSEVGSRKSEVLACRQVYRQANATSEFFNFRLPTSDFRLCFRPCDFRLFFPLLVCAALAAGEAPLINTNAIDAEHAPVVAESELFRTRIIVQNPHDVAVKIASLDATCTCSTLELGTRFLLPHSTTELLLETDNRNRSGVQRIGVSLYLSDPDREPIEVVAWWTARAHVQVDSLAAPDADPLARPPRAFQDIYRFPSKARPDELAKLRKRIRLSCPPGEIPEGGLQVTGITYSGKLWAFTPAVQSDGSILIEARGIADAVVAQQVHDEEVVVLTNHAKKSRIPLIFITYIGKDAGAVAFDPDSKRGGEFKATPPQ